MRAGKLDRTISIVRETFTDDGGGGQIPGPGAVVATLRAQLIEASTEEFIRNYGASSESVIVFRTRWTPDVLLSDVVDYEGQTFNLIETKELGRRRGLDIRCRRLGAP